SLPHRERVDAGGTAPLARRARYRRGASIGSLVRSGRSDERADRAAPPFRALDAARGRNVALFRGEPWRLGRFLPHRIRAGGATGPARDGLVDSRRGVAPK